jgi:hypothetical protein
VKLLLATLGSAFVVASLVACPGPKMPTGPAPEYEDPPAPSWLKDAAVEPPAPPPGILDPAPAPASVDGGLPTS